MSEQIERSPWMAVTAEDGPLALAVEPTAAAIDIDLPLGCDTSFHQGVIDWISAQLDGVVFAFIRWGQRGDWFDSQADDSWFNAKVAGILRGAYWVWDERDGADAEDHFQGVLAVASNIGLDHYDGELPLVVDLELEPVDWDELEAFLVRLEGWMGRQPMIYTGSWFYARVKPLPDWLAEYDHWLTGYNDEGPSIWGPLAQLDPPVVCWQQANNWQVDWTGGLGAVDRNFWWAGSRHLLEYADMAKKVVNADDLAAWIAANAYDAIPVGDGPPPVTPFKLAWPVPDPKVVTQWYGINPQFYPGQKGHEGLDLRAPNRTPVMAMADGEVYRVEDDPESGPYGKHIRVKHEHAHGVYKSIYAHLLQSQVSEGDQVQQGITLGLADNTGNSSGAHLHITLKKEGDGSDWLNLSDIVNPVPYMPDLFPITRIFGYTGQGWLVDVAGNFRTAPELGDNILYLIRANEVVRPTGLFTGDWWECEHATQLGWFWNPGYKLEAL